MAAHAASCNVARNQVAPLPVVVGCRFPALSWLPGQSRAQDAKCAAVGNASMSAPVSARIACAARAATPGIVWASTAASANGAIASSIRGSSVVMWLSSASMGESCCWIRKAEAGGRRPETGAQQTTFEQLRQPLTVSDVGLAARHHLDVPRVHEDQAHGVL